ncbi:hypothetical protein [Tamlana flava]|uniref:hypothetical protein n=1 Tax=Tamlana flava TaxID=3158572 RepID=UPI00351BB343
MRKNLFFVLVLSLFFIGCKNDAKSTTPEVMDELTEVHSLEGAWELVSFLNYRDDGQVDSIKSSNDFKQMKMFSETKIMWSRLRTWDSLDWFGVGDYTYKDGILTENLEYGSKAMMERINADKAWDWEITIDENSFTQITRDSLGQPVYAEIYNRVK